MIRRRAQFIAGVREPGMDSGTDPHAQRSQWLVAANATYPRAGVIAKRNGQDRSAAADGDAIGATRVSAFGDAAVLWGGGPVSTYDPVSDETVAVGGSTMDDQWPLSVTAQRYNAASDASARLALSGWHDVALTDDIVVIMAGVVESGSTNKVAISTYSRATGARIDTVLSASTAGRLITISGAIHAWLAASGSVGRRVIAADGSIGSQEDIAGAGAVVVSNLSRMDACACGTTAAVVWRVASGVKLAMCPLGAPASATVVDVEAANANILAPVGVWSYSSGSGAVVLWAEDNAGTGSVFERAYNTAAVETLAKTTIDTDSWDPMPTALAGIGRKRSTDGADVIGRIFVSCNSLLSSSILAYSTELDGTVTGPVAISDAQLMCRPVGVGASDYALPHYYQIFGRDFGDGFDARQGSMLMRSPSNRIIARGLYGRVRAHASGVLSGAAVDSSGRIIVPCRELLQADLSAGAGRFDQGLSPSEGDLYASTLLTYTLEATSAAIEHDGVLYIGGALPSVLDGAGLTEWGFISKPEIDSITSTGAPGGLEAGATYSYRIVAERVLSNGARVQSAPSEAVSYSPAVANDTAPTVAVIVPPTNDAWGRSQIAVYRSQANLGGIGPYYRVGSIYMSSTLAYPDTSDDDTIAINEQLYSSSGILDRYAPPPFTVASLHGDRMIAVSDEDGELYYSQPVRAGYPIEWSPALRLTLRVGGRVTGAASLQGRALLWTERDLWGVDGEPRNELGQGAGYNEPYLLAPGRGCGTHRSVVATPRGISWADPDGDIWSVNAGSGIDPTGAPVSWHAERALPVDAYVHGGLVQWVYAGGEQLVYDPDNGLWSVWTGHAGVAAARVGDVSVRLDSSGYLWVPNGEYDDNGAFVSLGLDSGWIQAGGRGGWQAWHEAIVTGYLSGAADVRVRIAYDLDPTWVDDTTYDSSSGALVVFGAGEQISPAPGYTDKSMMLSVCGSRAKAAAVRLRIDDVSDGSGATAGISVTGLWLQVSPLPGARRVGSSREV